MNPKLSSLGPVFPGREAPTGRLRALGGDGFAHELRALVRPTAKAPPPGPGDLDNPDPQTLSWAALSAAVPQVSPTEIPSLGIDTSAHLSASPASLRDTPPYPESGERSSPVARDLEPEERREPHARRSGHARSPVSDALTESRKRGWPLGVSSLSHRARAEAAPQQPRASREATRAEGAPRAPDDLEASAPERASFEERPASSETEPPPEQGHELREEQGRSEPASQPAPRFASRIEVDDAEHVLPPRSLDELLPPLFERDAVRIHVDKQLSVDVSAHGSRVEVTLSGLPQAIEPLRDIGPELGASLSDGGYSLDSFSANSEGEDGSPHGERAPRPEAQPSKGVAPKGDAPKAPALRGRYA